MNLKVSAADRDTIDRQNGSNEMNKTYFHSFLGLFYFLWMTLTMYEPRRLNSSSNTSNSINNNNNQEALAVRTDPRAGTSVASEHMKRQDTARSVMRLSRSTWGHACVSPIRPPPATRSRCSCQPTFGVFLGRFCG